MFLALIFLSDAAEAGGRAYGPPRRPRPQAITRAEALAALQALEAAYEGRHLVGFLDHVSDRYQRNYLDLKDRVDRDLYGFDRIEINFFVNEVLLDGPRASVRAHWNRRHLPKGVGRLALSEGDTTFLFRKEGEKVLLYDMRGDRLFGVSP